MQKPSTVLLPQGSLSASTACAVAHFAARFSRTALALFALLFIAANAYPAGLLGQLAPSFQAIDLAGKQRSLADFKGKTVVLEWFNPGCPFVRKHYHSGNMQGTQKAAQAQGVVWLAISSTERAHPDWLSPAQLASWQQGQGSAPSATLLDEDGAIGKAYGARTTPHLYIVNPQGVLVYAGGIDSIPSASEADIAQATNYVKQGLAESLAGKAISAANTRPYGCSVKYKS